MLEAFGRPIGPYLAYEVYLELVVVRLRCYGLGDQQYKNKNLVLVAARGFARA